MKSAKRLVAALIAVLVLWVAASGASALAAMSDDGAGAAQLGDHLFVVLPDGDASTLYSVPAAGGDLNRLVSTSSIGDLVVVGDYVYFLQSDGTVPQLMRMDAEGNLTVLVAFESEQVVTHLSFYDDVMYCLVDGQLTLVDPENGDSIVLCEELINEYTIVSDVIFYVSATETASYEQTMSDGTVLTTASGKLYSMTLLGTNSELLVDKGVSDLKAYDDQLFFHNYEDCYVSKSGDSLWLEGKLYRYNIQTGQMSSMNMDYDWEYFPTAQGVLVYTSENISLYPLTSGDGVLLMSPEVYTSLSVYGDSAYVFEHTAQLLTRVPLDGTAATPLNPGSGIITGEDELDTKGLAEDGDEASEDETGDEADDSQETANSGSSSSTATSSGYIFPNSSKKKLTRAQILKVDKDKWGYARNEIWARHGYVFKNSKYKKYFENKTWYNPGGFSTKSLNSIEWYNMELIKSLEQEYGLLPSDGKNNSGSSSGGSSDSDDGKTGGYLLPNARTKKYTESSLKKALGGDTSLLGYARNEILARHGYVFKTAKYKNYFAKKSWYKAGGYSSGDLNATEWHNINLIKKLEKKYN